jgi:hypothetical protein
LGNVDDVAADLNSASHNGVADSLRSVAEGIEHVAHITLTSDHVANRITYFGNSVSNGVDHIDDILYNVCDDSDDIVNDVLNRGADVGNCL